MCLQFVTSLNKYFFDGEKYFSRYSPEFLGVSKKSSNFFDNIDARDVKNIIDENNNPE